jgi:[acyl-carrier-protein] S-malonyltransferase
MYAIVFPGQGSQTVGMATDFAERFPEARAVLEQADDAFGGPLSKWIAEGPEEQLRRTEVTQPALLTASIAMYRALEPRLPAPPACFAGHSLGEYTALVAAGALELADAVRLVRQRGAFMQEAVPEGEGAMAAVIGLDGDAIAALLEGVSGVVAPANFNSPQQTVIAGESAAVERAGAVLKEAGAKRVLPLDVSAPFHCELMAPAMRKLEPLLAETAFAETTVPILSNVTCESYTGGERARELLLEQVCAPVRWSEEVAALGARGVKLQLEIGPGKVLSGLAARIDKGLGRAQVSDTEGVDAALAAVAEAAA